MRNWITLPLFLSALVLDAAVIGPIRDYPDLKKDEREKKLELLITENKKSYQIQFTGQLDGFRTRMPSGHSAPRTAWQPNRFVRIENVGAKDVLNPRIHANGRGPWMDIRHMLSVALAGTRNDREKTRAIYEFVKEQRFHATTWDRQVSDPVRNFNVYGFTLCENSSDILERLWHSAGIKCRKSMAVGHIVSEAFYEGGYHLFDADTDTIFLDRDNKTVASQQQVVWDHDLIRRTHTYSILSADSPDQSGIMAARFALENHRTDHDIFPASSRYDVKLRPGESIEWRWDHKGKHYTADPGQDLRSWGQSAYAGFCNGNLRYIPDLTSSKGIEGLAKFGNSRLVAGKGIFPLKPGKKAELIWQVSSSYVFVGSRVTLEWEKSDGDPFSIDFSRDGKAWAKVFESSKPGENSTQLHLDPYLSLPNLPDFRFYLRVTMQASSLDSVFLKKIEFDSDFQHSCSAIPELKGGENQMFYQDDSQGARKVLVTHAWIERQNWSPPPPPVTVFPANGSTVEGTKVHFQWRNPIASRSKIVDYHIQLADRNDFRWVLSSNFDRLISLTPEKGKEEWHIPYTGLLNPQETYFWRVRSMDEAGAWSDWSKPSAFVCNAPGIPLSVRTELRAEKATGFSFLTAFFGRTFQNQTVVLNWIPNPTGSQASKYRIYASNEKGFTADQNRTRSPAGDPFVDVTSTTAIVAGRGFNSPVANHAFYRVAAIDKKGNESAASDLVEVTTPFIYSIPPEVVRVGTDFHYQTRSIQSAGNRICKRPCDSTYWNRPLIKYKMVEGPPWLRIDPVSGILRGRVQSKGKFKVVVVAENSSGARDSQKFHVEVQ